MTRTIGIIGVGEIASAIVDGLCAQPGHAPAVYLSPRNQTIGGALASRHHTVQVCADNQAVADKAQTLILAVRPDILGDVLHDLRVPEDRIVISAVAGASHETLRRTLGDQVTVVRAIPLPAVRQRRGVTAIYPAHPEVERLFDGLGGTLAIDDAAAFTAIQTTTATISTHLHYLAAVATWLEERGITHADADRYVRSMFLGVAGGLADQARTLPELAIAHETPGGINEQLRRSWFTESNSAAFTQALEEIYLRLAR